MSDIARLHRPNAIVVSGRSGIKTITPVGERCLHAGEGRRAAPITCGMTACNHTRMFRVP